MDVIESMENASVRVDGKTQKGSVLDVIKMVLGGDSSMANTTLRRLVVANPVLDYTRIKINNKGNTTPVADAKTLIQIIWLLPGRKAREFRHASSEKVCRLLGGDLSLVSEIEARHVSLQASEEGRSTQQFLLGGSSSGDEHAITENFAGMPAVFRYLPGNDRADFAKRMLSQQLENEKQNAELQLRKREQELMECNAELKRRRCDDLLQTYKTMQADLGVTLDERTRIEIRDNIAIISRLDFSAVNLHNAVATVVTATPLLADSSTPTHELDAAQRGQETGIVPVSAKVGLRVPKNMSGTVGKLLKQLYIAKYSLEPNWNGFTKRQTLFQGRPVLENVYYERDEDIVERAIREVVQ